MKAVHRFLFHTRFGWYFWDLVVVAWQVLGIVSVIFVAVPSRYNLVSGYVIVAAWVLLRRHDHQVDYKVGWRSGFCSAAAHDLTPITRDAVTGDVAPNPWDDHLRVDQITLSHIEEDNGGH